jgi:RNA ligase (TIGR02306 family)
LDEFIGRECVITQKVDGTSGTFYLRGGKFGVCTRNLELVDDPASMFWRVAREHKLREAMVTLGGDYALQGEVHGEGIQGNHLGAKGVRFAVFNLFDIQNHAYAHHQTLEGFCQTTGLPMVRIVWRGEFRFTLTELVQLASSQDYVPGQPAEGIVIRPVVEERSRILESGRLSAKVISERYALKYGE